MNLRIVLHPILITLLLCHCSPAEPVAGAPRAASSLDGRGLDLDHIAAQSSGDNRLFLQYDVSGKAVWNPDWPSQVDMTGVAWDSVRAGTAITPRHVVMAGHFPRKVGSSLVFHDRQGVRHARTLKQVIALRKRPVAVDIAVGLLDRPLPAGIKTYPLLEPGSDYGEKLSGGLVLVTDQKRRLFVHEILFVNVRSVKFLHGAAADKSKHVSLVAGDSGHPSFILLDGEPVLLETHSIGGPGAGPCYSVQPVFEALRKAVRELDPDYDLETRNLGKSYTASAKKRRAKDGQYAIWNTDGSMKPNRKSRPITNPQPPQHGPKTQPRDPRVPRVRRLPDKKVPTHEDANPSP